MKAKKIILAPAKLNIFLKVLGKRKDGYHIIRSGITFINLFDQIEICESKEINISYKGPFKPKNNYANCIILKTLEFLKLDKNLKFNITITKNIPVQGGLGSASTNAASVIIGLSEMNLIELKEPKKYISLGSDIPCFLLNKNCLLTGIGDQLYPYSIPKYFFLLVKPNLNNSTKEMYKALGFDCGSIDINLNKNNFGIQDDDNGNDFEKIISKKFIKIKSILEFLANLDEVIFARLTGSGSVCFAAFETMDMAKNGKKIFIKEFPNLWTQIVENNYNL